MACRGPRRVRCRFAGPVDSARCGRGLRNGSGGVELTFSGFGGWSRPAPRSPRWGELGGVAVCGWRRSARAGGGEVSSCRGEVAPGPADCACRGVTSHPAQADCARRGVRWPRPGRLRTPPGDVAPRARPARCRCGVRRGPGVVGEAASRWRATRRPAGRGGSRGARAGSGPSVQQGGPAATGSEQGHPAAMRTWPGHGIVASVQPVIASSGATGTPAPLWHHSRRSREPTVNCRTL